MKKAILFSSLIAFGLGMSFTACRKAPAPDPCENVQCPPGTKCVKGVCIEIRKG